MLKGSRHLSPTGFAVKLAIYNIYILYFVVVEWVPNRWSPASFMLHSHIAALHRNRKQRASAGCVFRSPILPICPPPFPARPRALPLYAATVQLFTSTVRLLLARVLLHKFPLQFMEGRSFTHIPFWWNSSLYWSNWFCSSHWSTPEKSKLFEKQITRRANEIVNIKLKVMATTILTQRNIIIKEIWANLGTRPADSMDDFSHFRPKRKQ